MKHSLPTMKHSLPLNNTKAAIYQLKTCLTISKTKEKWQK